MPSQFLQVYNRKMDGIAITALLQQIARLGAKANGDLVEYRSVVVQLGNLAQQRIREFEPQHLADLSQSLARIQHHDEAVVARLVAQSQPLLHRHVESSVYQISIMS